MYSLGIPERQFRRTTQVLGPEAADPIEYDASKQDDGFYLFTFPNCDEYDFRKIVNLLKSNGVTTIGADSQLTEKNIMKLTNLIKEQGSPDENDLIDILKDALKRMESKDYRGGGFESNELSDHYLEDIRDIIEDYEEESSADAIAMGADDVRDMQEQESSDRDTSKDTTAGEFNVNVSIQNETEKVNIKYGHATGPVDDVTISWGEESHNVDFEAEDVIDDHGNEGKDMTFVAFSQDDKWRFIVDVSVGFNYEDSGEIYEVHWDTLEIDVDDAKVNNPINESYFKTQMQKRAGIIK